MKQVSVNKLVLRLAPLALAVSCSLSLLSGCSSDSSDPVIGSNDASISGTIVAAPVNGADVSVVDGSGNVVVDPVPTDANGQYSLVIPNGSLAQNLIIKSTGGTFTDEATGDQPIDAGELLAYVSANSISNGGSVSATPGSTIIAKLVMDPSNGINTQADAEAVFDSAFGYTPDLSVEPADATAPAADATDASKLAGLRAAAFSQLTMDMGLLAVEQFDLLTALAADLADGELDGKNASGDISITTTVMMPIDIQNRFVTALTNFHDSGLMGDVHGNDKTGLDNSQIGILPFSKVALTSLYKVEYVPGMMDPMQGKSMFKLRISDKVTGAAVSENMTLMLMMYMEDRQHSTPDLNCKESVTTAGEYDCTVYYVMSSVMATGDAMGYWQINVMDKANKQSAMFYPTVMMAMGDTARILLKGQAGSDIIMMMGEPVSRPYNLFKESLMGTTGNHTFEVFIAPMETMMSFPALEAPMTLIIDPVADPVTTFPINNVTVAFSTDETNWTTATNAVNGSGIWSAPIDGLTDGTEGNIYVELRVNGELKTTNGFAPDGMNEYSFFKVTPGGM